MLIPRRKGLYRSKAGAAEKVGKFCEAVKPKRKRHTTNARAHIDPVVAHAVGARVISEALDQEIVAVLAL